MRPLTRWGRYKRERRRLLAEYERACRHPVSVFAFGAKADGTDDAPAIQATLDFVAKYGGGSVGVRGTHTIRKSINGHGLTLRPEGGDKE